MHDPVDIRRRIDRLVARVDRRDDYGQLLVADQVIHEVDDGDDVDAWRAEIRRQARADKIKVRTGFNDGIVWALRAPAQSAWDTEMPRIRDVLSHTVPRAVELQHELSVNVRDGDEVVCACGRYSTLGYAQSVKGVMGGTLFEGRVPERGVAKADGTHDDVLAGLALACVMPSRCFRQARVPLPAVAWRGGTDRRHWRSGSQRVSIAVFADEHTRRLHRAARIVILLSWRVLISSLDSSALPGSTMTRRSRAQLRR